MIPVAFHVVYTAGRRSNEGNIPDSMIYDQIDVLNAAYQAHGRSSSSTGFSPDGDELLPLVEGARLRGVGEGAS